MSENDRTETYAVRWGVATDAGCVREENEDSLLAGPPVFLVADGMGGHLRGKEASAHVVEAFEPVVGSEWLSLEAVESAVVRAVEFVADLSEQTRVAPGSTVSGLGLSYHEGALRWLVFNVGDSRTYRLSGTRLQQVTVDHSEAQELLDKGMSTVEVDALALGHVITRAIGGGGRSVPVVDQWLLPAHPGDRMLVCSDGLTDELTDEHIATILRAPLEADATAKALVEAALAAGGRDNVTVIVVDAPRIEGRSGPGPADEVTRPDLTVFATNDATVTDELPVPTEAEPHVGGA